MIPRSHAHKPVSRDRGPESKEDTQTNFDSLNVLGNIPAPTTAIDACLDSGFHLNNGVKLTDGNGLLLVGGEAFAWRPWKAVEGAENDSVAKDAMLNSKGQFELDESVWGLLNLVWPKPGLFFFFFFLLLSDPEYMLSPTDDLLKLGHKIVLRFSNSSTNRYAHFGCWWHDVPALARD